MRFRAVVFDLFGTLLEVSPVEEYREMVRKMASVLDAGEEAFLGAWLGTREQRLTGAIPTVEENLAAACKEIRVTPRGGHIKKAARINEAYIRDLLTRWKEDALPTVKELKSRGMRLGLLSDCYSTTANLWGEGPLAPHFDAAVFSCKAGACKPDARLFTMVAERLGVAPEECLYVGDGGGDELTGAAARGMTTILVVNDRRDPHLKDSPSLACPRTVKKLSEVLGWVENTGRAG